MHNEILQYWVNQIKYLSTTNSLKTRKVMLISNLAFYLLILLLIYFNMIYNSYHAIVAHIGEQVKLY